jgi:hypothetical protein
MLALLSGAELVFAHSAHPSTSLFTVIRIMCCQRPDQEVGDPKHDTPEAAGPHVAEVVSIFDLFFASVVG